MEGETGSMHTKLAMESDEKPHWIWSDKEAIYLIGGKAVRKVGVRG
jgi:hypothetical protein